MRSEASGLKLEAIRIFEAECHVHCLEKICRYAVPKIGVASSSSAGSRLDSTYYFPPAADARLAFDQAIAQHSGKMLGEVAEIFIPTIFKREYADDPDHGVPYYY